MSDRKIPIAEQFDAIRQTLEAIREKEGKPKPAPEKAETNAYADAIYALC